VAGVAVGSRNTRYQAACWALPGSDFHRLIAPALLGAFAATGQLRTYTGRQWRRPSPRFDQMWTPSLFVFDTGDGGSRDD
jgi:hypothetical protein